VTFNSQGLSLDYRVAGDAGKPPVVFVHGFPFSQEMWSPQVQTLQSAFRVITYDHRGHGRSDAGDGQYLLEFLVDDLIALLDHLKIEKAILCGLSMGGYVALRAVERNPERVRALVLCDTRSEADTNEAKLKRAAGIRTIKEKGVPAFAEGFLKQVFAPKSFETQPQAVELIRKIILANPPLGICGTLLALASRTDTTAALPGITVPTLVLVGDQDPITPPAAAQSIQKAVPGAELHILPNAAHMSNLENTEAFNQHLLAFLKKITG
jgi:3-oxoadipate enol-lactonase